MSSPTSVQDLHATNNNDEQASPSIDGSTFSSNASILLVGMSGAGKKTLGIIGSLALRWPYIDFKSFFKRCVGASVADYYDTEGVDAYRARELEVVARLLDDYRCNHIIGGLSDSGSVAMKDLLSQHAQAHPVIYIRRDREQLHESFRAGSVKHDNLYQDRDEHYRSCSSLDFFNISAPRQGTTEAVHNRPDTLKLKDAEIDFAAFLRRILGHTKQQHFYSADPLSRSFTYALHAPMWWLESSEDLDELECGADVITLFVDQAHETVDLHSCITKQVARVRRRTKVPLMIEVRCPGMQLEHYVRLLKCCQRCLPDYLAIDLDILDTKIIPSSSLRSIVKTIGTSYLSVAWAHLSSSDVVAQLHSKCCAFSCSAVRLVRNPEHAIENLDCIVWARENAGAFPVPLAAYNTGLAGRTSICFNRILSPVVPRSLDIPGLTVQRAQSALYASFVLTRKRFTIFGASISYSLSPRMHNAAYRLLGMPHIYSSLQSSNFEEVHSLLEEPECGGIVITLPYKTEALKLLHNSTPEVQAIGAVNTIVVEQGKDTSKTLKGYNTDHIGIRTCVFKSLSPANTIHSGSCALILGAGGMARAAIYALRTLGVSNFCISNRTLSRAQDLADSHICEGLNVHVLKDVEQGWPAGLHDATIVISTIPAHSIRGSPANELDIPEQWLQSSTGGVFMEVSPMASCRSANC